ncbi:hypothetical protein AAE478_006131 [Parahypoxylon ruwenzoriense]
MHFFSGPHLFGVATAAVAFVKGASAERIPAAAVAAAALERRQYQNYCCTVGCLYCSVHDCDSCDLAFPSCCAEGRREADPADPDGILVYNGRGQRMVFAG